MSNNIEDQFDKWTQQWDKALADGVFPKSESKPKEIEDGKSNFFGQINIKDSEVDPEEDSVSYWNDIANYSESQLLNENKTTKIAKSSNPVDYTNLGKDAKNKPTEDWTEGESLDKLNELKKKLYELEVNFLSKHAMGVKEDDLSSIKKEMESVASMIDKISDKMGALRLTPEPK